MRARALCFFVVLVACGSPLVGGECLPGYVACGGQCVQLASDPQHCGECGHSCGRASCIDASCATTDDALPTPGEDGAAPVLAGTPEQRDASMSSDGAPQDASEIPDAATTATGCGLGLAACEQTCVDLDTDRQHCGVCGVACQDNEVCSDGTCAQVCTLGWNACGGGCADLSQDSDHCGDCGTVCASGICESGICADAVAGHVVVLGHTYVQSNEFQNTLLGNAVFLASGAEVRTLVYEGSAEAASVAGVHAAIDEVALSLGRSWQLMVADAKLVTVQLETVQVFLIHEQSGSADSELDGLGQSWALALLQFVARGGVIVLVEGGSANNSGTHRVLAPAGIFQAGGRQVVTGDVEVVAPGFGIALRVGDRYRGESESVGFFDVQSSGIVVSRVGNLPVVFQRVIEP